MTKHNDRYNRALLPALVATLLLVASAAADEREWTLITEHWYALSMGDMASGWMHQTEHTDGEHVRTRIESRMSMSRLEAAGEIVTVSTFIETEAGKLIEMSSQQAMSQQPVHSRWVFDNGAVTHTTTQGGRESTSEHEPPDGQWLTPRAARRFFAERQAAGAQEITYRILDPENGLTPVTVRHTRIEPGRFDLGEREIPVTIWKSSSDLMPLQAVEHVTSEGHVVFQEISSGLGTITLRRVSRDEALAQQDVKLAPMMVQTFVTPQGTFADVMNVRFARYELRVKGGEMPGLPSAGAQNVQQSDDAQRVRLVVNLDEPLPASADELENDDYRRSSPLIDSDDALVKALARRALREADLGDADNAEQAEAMRAFVHRFITNPTLDVPFGSASETARTRSGDCSEFAVLLAAMLRAADIPARVASGLVYADQFAGSDDIFGWHMWTQALIDGKWIDLDATLPVPYHAGHILTGTSSLARTGHAADMTAIVTLLGNLEIEILDSGR